MGKFSNGRSLHYTSVAGMEWVAISIWVGELIHCLTAELTIRKAVVKPTRTIATHSSFSDTDRADIQYWVAIQ